MGGGTPGVDFSSNPWGSTTSQPSNGSLEPPVLFRPEKEELPDANARFPTLDAILGGMPFPAWQKAEMEARSRQDSLFAGLCFCLIGRGMPHEIVEALLARKGEMTGDVCNPRISHLLAGSCDPNGTVRRAKLWYPKNTVDVAWLVR